MLASITPLGERGRQERQIGIETWINSAPPLLCAFCERRAAAEGADRLLERERLFHVPAAGRLAALVAPLDGRVHGVAGTVAAHDGRVAPHAEDGPGVEQRAERVALRRRLGVVGLDHAPVVHQVLRLDGGGHAERGEAREVRAADDLRVLDPRA